MPKILFFHRVLINSHHVLQLVLPQQHQTQYNLRARRHDRLLIPKTADLNDRDFIVRISHISRVTIVHLLTFTDVLFYRRFFFIILQIIVLFLTLLICVCHCQLFSK